MPFVSRPTCTLHYEDVGPREAPAVVCLPSLLCDGSMFAHLAHDLSRDHRVLVLDMRGHGRSSTPSRGYTMEDQADDVAALLDHAQVRRAALVGLSQGGMTAIRAAAFHTTRVAGLVLLDTSAEPEAVATRVQYLAMALSVRARGVTPDVIARVKPLMFSDAFMARAPEAVARFVAGTVRMDPRATWHAVWAVAMRSDARELLPRIRVPTQVLSGGADRALPPSFGQRVAEGIAGASHHVLAGAGHLSTVEQPEETTSHVRAFLEAHQL